MDKSCFSLQSHRSAIWLIYSSWSTQASVSDRVCSQWHSSPSRQLWTPWVKHEKKTSPNDGVAPEEKHVYFSQFCSFNPSSVPPTHQRLRKNHEAVPKTVLHKNNSGFTTFLASQQRICEKQLPKSTLLHYCWVIPSASLLLPGKSYQYIPSPFVTPLRASVNVHDDSVFLTNSFQFKLL